MRLTIQLDSQAAKIRAVQAARVCSSGWLPSQSRAMISSSFMGAPAEKGGLRVRPNGGTLANSRLPVRYIKGSADEFAADGLEQLGTGALHPLERHHLA